MRRSSHPSIAMGPALVACALMVALPLGAPNAQTAARAAAQAAWVDSVTVSMSLRAKVSQMVMRWIPGSFIGDTAGSDFATARRMVVEDSLGGFIISIGTPADLARKTNALQRLARVPLLFTADLEFGPGHRLLPGGTTFPPPMGIAATGDPAASCWHGRITALEARAVGIHLTFAPTVDLNVLPDNPIVNTRAYGEDAATVVRYAVPFIQCAQDNGLLTTAKHFVGHGAARVDSHIGRPVLSLDRARLDSAEYRPFRAAQAAGVAGIMSAHIALPRMSGDSLPVSLNPRLLSHVLRDDWRFGGLVVTDALWMGGAVQSASEAPGRIAVRAVQAGNDVILDPRDHRAMIDSLVAAVRRGTLSEARIDSSVRRILMAKARVGLDTGRFVDLARVQAIVGTPAADSIATAVAQASIVLARDELALLPIARRRPGTAAGETILVVVYLDEGESPAPGVRPGVAFASELRRLLGKGAASVQVEVTTSRTPRERLRPILERAAGADLVVLAPYIRPLASKGSIGLPADLAMVYRDVLRRQPRTVVVSFGDPYLIRQIPSARTYVLAWNPWSPWSERAAARAITGRTPITGRLPVTISPSLPAGHGIAMNAMVFDPPPPRDDPRLTAALRDTVLRLLERAISDSAFPGAYAVVGTHDRILASVGAGRLDWSASPAPDEHTIWDLASLTKVVGMTTALMQLVEEGRVELDAPVERYLTEWTGSGKDRVTVRDLLTHSAGLPAWRPLYKEAPDAASALALVVATPLDTVPGARYVYSDLGAILLGQIVERVSGEPLDVHLRRRVFEPLGMTATGFRPDASLRSRIAPTEYDPWRQRHLRGEVHDENAFALGGVAGHAGLFSTAHDLARFAQMYLNGGALGPRRVFTPRTMAIFTTVQDRRLSHRGLGWETPTGTNSSGRGLSPTAFGHTGFTGTSLWIDPASDLFIILLTNRVNPTRENRRIGAVRIALADAVTAALQAEASAPPVAPPSSP